MEHDPLTSYSFFLVGLFLTLVIDKIPSRRFYSSKASQEEQDRDQEKFLDIYFALILALATASFHHFFIPAAWGIMLALQILLYRETGYLRHGLLLLLPFILTVGLAFLTDSGHIKLGAFLVTSFLGGLYLYLLNRTEE
ncbi:hypothetical protein [Streptococcus oricebi]|uniref:Uncharacterized protein n=1 Tax=Streptococcus oricebi TaxID=1547447 RepID=A0ABS5B2M7_9STRE|nr:hypothetical protein [Streptococcus oricebi]MBP2623062.1 hypothetical protein [Streptococcus oricebi]